MRGVDLVRTRRILSSIAVIAEIMLLIFMIVHSTISW